MAERWEEPHEFTPCTCGCGAPDVCDVCGDLHEGRTCAEHPCTCTDRENRSEGGDR